MNFKPEPSVKKEVIHQDNIFEIEVKVLSDIEGGLDIEHDCIYGYLRFLQVPSYQVADSSLCDSEMTIELMSQIQSINVRLYRMEVSGIQINNDSELQNVVNSENVQQYKYKFKKQMVKEYEVVDGFPILDEFDHSQRFDTSEMLKAYRDYKIEFRLPLKGISRRLLSTTLMNVCNMFSTLYFMQTVVILKSNSI